MSSRRKFTPEYRQEAARLVMETDRSIAEVARELGVNSALLGRWVKTERQRAGTDAQSGELSSDERKELARLRKEVAELNLDNEFLGKAAAFFASKRPK